MPPRDHDMLDPMVQRHVGELSALKVFGENTRELVHGVGKELDEMRKTHALDIEKVGTRCGLLEQDLVVLKVKFATYSAIAVFVANVAFKLIFG